MKLMSIALMALLSLAHGAAQDVRYDFATADFKKFKTYTWVEIKDAQKVDELKDMEIKGMLEAALSKKHLTKTDADTADLYIGYQVGGDAEKPFASYNNTWDYGPGWNRESWYGAGLYHQNKGPISTIHAGQLAVDMYDSKKHCLVWRGVVSKVLDHTVAPEMEEKNLHKAVDKLLTKYPPPPLYSISD